MRLDGNEAVRLSVSLELRMSEEADARPDREYSYPIKHRPAHAIHRRSALLGLLEVDFSLGAISNPATAPEALEAPILAGVLGGGGRRSPEEIIPAAGNAERRPALSAGRMACTGGATGAKDRVRTTPASQDCNGRVRGRIRIPSRAR